MDSLLAMKRLEDGPYTYQTSSRKWKLDDDSLTSWSDGSADFAVLRQPGSFPGHQRRARRPVTAQSQHGTAKTQVASC
jgi:hypothetical protein